ncbi:hypothetical protein EJB05_54766, partial [Eragrostis curvula]
MAEAYLLEEVSNFTTKYYADNLPSVHNPPPRYNVAENDSRLSLFQGQLGSASGATSKFLAYEEWRTIMLYVLTNLKENVSYIEEFVHQFWRRSRDPTSHEIDTLLKQGAGSGKPDFISWFKKKGDDFFQDNGLEGSFVIDLTEVFGMEVDNEDAGDEVDDAKDLQILERLHLDSDDDIPPPSDNLHDYVDMHDIDDETHEPAIIDDDDYF